MPADSTLARFLRRIDTLMEWCRFHFACAIRMSALSGVILVWSMVDGEKATAQAIQFSTYFSPGLNVTQESDLEFGALVRNSGQMGIGLGDPGMAVISIVGQADLDVIVSIDGPGFLEHESDPGSQIPLTIYAAFANRGRDSIADAVQFNGSTARITIRGRDFGPPRPPPTPAHEGYSPPSDVAYLYLYGSLDVGSVLAGQYTGTINISVLYD